MKPNSEQDSLNLSPNEPSVQDWVNVSTMRARVFERYGIGYCCCGGRKTLTQACDDAGIAADSVLADLGCADEATQRKQRGIETPSMRARHCELREELPRLSGLVAKVAGKHSSAFPQARSLQAVYEELRSRFEKYIDAEETAFAEYGSAGKISPVTIDGLENARDAVEDEMGKLRRESQNFALPEGACITYRVAMESLAGLEGDWRRYLESDWCRYLEGDWCRYYEPGRRGIRTQAAHRTA